MSVKSLANGHRDLKWESLCICQRGHVQHLSCQAVLGKGVTSPRLPAGCCTALVGMRVPEALSRLYLVLLFLCHCYPCIARKPHFI